MCHVIYSLPFLDLTAFANSVQGETPTEYLQPLYGPHCHAAVCSSLHLSCVPRQRGQRTHTPKVLCSSALWHILHRLPFSEGFVDLEKEFEQNVTNSTVYLISMVMQLSNFAVNYKVWCIGLCPQCTYIQNYLVPRAIHLWKVCVRTKLFSTVSWCQLLWSLCSHWELCLIFRPACRSSILQMRSELLCTGGHGLSLVVNLHI